MFRSARLKLTAWYLLIILLVSISFSVVIYQVLSGEVDRLARAQRFRLEREVYNGSLDVVPPPNDFPLLDDDLVIDAKKHLLYILISIDGSIAVIAGGLGFILAGRTLEPIQEMVEEQNRFISDSSHELRTPLTSLKSAFEVNLRDKKLTIKDARILIVESIDEVNKLQSLSDQLLQLAQYQRPQNFPKLANISLQDCLEKTIKKITPIAQKKNITIENNATDISFPADSSQLSEVFTIFLDNAIKYSPSGSVISVNSSHPDNSVVISFTDHGLGISPKDTPHIFDRFYRADSARSKTDASGYGLGLSIAKRIVDLHHGTITVKSQPGEGSTFIIRLPRHQAKA